MLYAESFEKYGCVPVGFEERNVEKDGNYHSIIYYKEALKYAPTVNDEIRTLRRIAKKQNKKDIKGYIDEIKAEIPIGARAVYISTIDSDNRTITTNALILKP